MLSPCPSALRKYFIAAHQSLINMDFVNCTQHISAGSISYFATTAAIKIIC